MNWKNFRSQVTLFKTWLQEYKYNDGAILYKIFALILRGLEDPYCIMALALNKISLREIATADLSSITPLKDLPDNVYEQLIRWINLLPREDGILGLIYEKLALDRKVQGLYYTPEAVIDFILNQTIGSCDITSNPKIRIIDPSCGCGSFLLKAYDLLFAKFVAARPLLSKIYSGDWSDSAIHDHIIKYNLWGSDIDTLASDIAFVSLMLKCIRTNNNVTANIIVSDSLNQSTLLTAAQQEKTFWSQKYHYVVGNPPYLSFGLRGAQKFDSQYLDYLRGTYVSAQYKLSIYVLFMQRGIDMLTPGGKLGFIVPDSFLLGRYYSKIREYILDNTDIKLIAHITSPVFRKATTGFLVICIFAKHVKDEKPTNNIINIYNIQKPIQSKDFKPVCQYSQSYFSSLPHKRFRIFFSEKAKQIIDRLDTEGAFLKNYASGHTGIRALSGQNNIISINPNGETWQQGLISGNQVQRYNLEYRGHWLNIDPQKIYKGGWNKTIIKQRKIVIRQTGYNITAAIDNNGYYHLNNIHSFITNHSNLSLDYLLLLLNSRLISFYYHVVTMEFGRPMAQIDIETLELLPIIIDQQINIQATKLIPIMEACVRKRLEKGIAVNNAESAFYEYLNQLVYHIYNLSDIEIKYIEDYERDISKNIKNKTHI